MKDQGLNDVVAAQAVAGHDPQPGREQYVQNARRILNIVRITQTATLSITLEVSRTTSTCRLMHALWISDVNEKSNVLFLFEVLL